MDRFRDQIKESARKHIGTRSIKDQGDQEVVIPGTGTDEPRFTHRSDNGDWDYVLPGNQDYLPGDTIDKPQSGKGSGRGTKGGKGSKGADDFSFFLSYDEYLDLIFDDLELPNLIKASEKTIQLHQMRRAGFTTAGVPSNLNVERTAIAGLGRRIALKTPKLAKIKHLEELLETEENQEEKEKIIEEIQALKIRASAISFLDRVDLRYNNFVPQPKPITQAVMFCILDVSFSMGEKEKIIAKKFFLLLHLFLKRRYKNIDVVFVRHHEEAEECDEETFFTSQESGGTMVSSAYEVVRNTINSRYPVGDWNIYVAQASDGDNYGYDHQQSQNILMDIMKGAQFMAYIEICRRPEDMIFGHTTNLWEIIEESKTDYPQIELQKIHDEEDVVLVFRKFFSRKE